MMVLLLGPGLGRGCNAVIDGNCTNYMRFPPVNLVQTASMLGGSNVCFDVFRCLAGAGRVIERRADPTDLQLVAGSSLASVGRLSSPHTAGGGSSQSYQSEQSRPQETTGDHRHEAHSDLSPHSPLSQLPAGGGGVGSAGTSPGRQE